MSTTRDIYERTFEFACRIVRLHRAMTRKRGTHTALLNQLLDSGTSVGANLEEAKGAQSRSDFIAKARISLKEARESHYWLRLIGACELVKPARIEPLIREANELVSILTAIVIRTKTNPHPSPTS